MAADTVSPSHFCIPPCTANGVSGQPRSVPLKWSSILLCPKRRHKVGSPDGYSGDTRHPMFAAMENSGSPKTKPLSACAERGSEDKSLTMTYFHRRPSTIIGAKAFHCPVRDGKEWYHLAMVVKRNCLAGMGFSHPGPIRKKHMVREYNSSHT